MFGATRTYGCLSDAPARGRGGQWSAARDSRRKPQSLPSSARHRAPRGPCGQVWALRGGLGWVSRCSRHESGQRGPARGVSGRDDCYIHHFVYLQYCVCTARALRITHCAAHEVVGRYKTKKASSFLKFCALIIAICGALSVFKRVLAATKIPSLWPNPNQKAGLSEGAPLLPLVLDEAPQSIGWRWEQGEKPAPRAKKCAAHRRAAATLTELKLSCSNESGFEYWICE